MSDRQPKLHELLQEPLAELNLQKSQQIIARLFECEFVEQHQSAGLIVPDGVDNCSKGRPVYPRMVNSS
jgi:hypothetical protein